MNFRAILSSRVHMWRMGKSVVNKTNEADGDGDGDMVGG